MAAQPLFACQIEAVKKYLHAFIEGQIDDIVEQVAAGALGVEQVERAVWGVVIALGRALMSALLSLLCFRRMTRKLASNGLTVNDVYVRTDQRGMGTLTTTFGAAPFAWFTYRERRGGPTKRPASSLFPLYQWCRSSRMCLEWECALGSEHPFRSAEQAIAFFTHGAVAVSDSTIERHAVAVGKTLTDRWLYRPRHEIVALLRERATIDALTQEPLVYASTDAHILRRYVDDTWNADWKAINGIRVWCIDRRTGEIIHLGGEFTWGNCEEVAERFSDLRRQGVLPNDGDYGSGVRAQLVFVSDGARWIEERVYKLFPEAVCILDAYHLLERFAKVAAEVHGAGTEACTRLQVALGFAMGLRERTARAPKRRKGHTKTRRVPRVLARVAPVEPAALHSRPQHIDRVVRALLTAFPDNAARPVAVNDLVAFLDDNAYRLDYATYRARGIQIGSGAMESMHRFGSQLRAKRSGCRWLADTVLSILNLRMLTRAGRWSEFWAQDDLDNQLAHRLAA